MVSCPYDPDEIYPLGNLAGWKLLGDLEGGGLPEYAPPVPGQLDPNARCADCSYAWVGGNCSRETIAESIFYPKETGNGEK